jgi:hypothetical protein
LCIPAYVIIRQHTSAYVSIRQHTSAYVSIRHTTPAPYLEATSVQASQFSQAWIHPTRDHSTCRKYHSCQYVYSCTSKAGTFVLFSSLDSSHSRSLHLSKHPHHLTSEKGIDRAMGHSTHIYKKAQYKKARRRGINASTTAVCMRTLVLVKQALLYFCTSKQVLVQ